MHGLHVSCPFNFPNGNLKQQWSHIGFFICCQTIDAKKKLNFPISGIHLLNPYKTVVSHLKTHGTIIRTRARWYEFGEKNSKYFLNLEKTNHRKKHVTSLINDSGMKITSPKEILKEEETFFQKIYRLSNKDANLPEFNQFFQAEKVLSAEMVVTCEGYIAIEGCAYVLKKMENNKTPGSDGLSVEFYRHFWNIITKYMVESFNYAFQSGHLSISQKQGIISLIPKKKKNTEYLKNWRPVSLLNVDYKVATKTIAT